MHLEYSPIEHELSEKIDKLFGVENCLIEVRPSNVLLPPKFQEIGERIKKMDVRSDDVWLVSYPRTGSTWAQELVWCVLNDLDFESAKQLAQFRTPLLELTALFGNDSREWKNALGNSVEQVENMESPRCIKSHLPWDLLPAQISTVQPKIIYVARNPKDVSVSYFHYCKLIHDFHGSYDEFCDLFLLGKTPVGNYWNHVIEFWKRRDDENILFLKYEDMKKDLRATIGKVTQFIGKNYSDIQVDSLIDHLSFANMRKNPAINLEPILQQMHPNMNEDKKVNGEENKFIRKGQVGDWKNHMSPCVVNEFDRMSRENWENIGLEFEN